MNNRHNPAFQQPEGDVAALTVIEAGVFRRDCVTLEYHLTTDEVDPMLAEIVTPLGFIPFEPDSDCSYILALRQDSEHRVELPGMAARGPGPYFQACASALVKRKRLHIDYHSRSKSTKTWQLLLIYTVLSIEAKQEVKRSSRHQR